ncbi:WD40 repeat domain-containing protein [Micromonospora citrea]|nr:WD40 repeat domain-containing protein [Micromonospora citrea]
MSSRIPSDSKIEDFDAVVVDGRPLVVCVDSYGQHALTWDPADDRWTEHQLANPWGPNGDIETNCLLTIGAVVHDGRIVVGGGGYEQPFAQWDLQTGAVVTYAREEHGGVAVTSTMRRDGRAVFVTGDSSAGSPVRLWDPSQRDSLTAYEDDWFGINYLAEPATVCRHRDSIGGLASATLRGRPVVISSGAGEVMVSDVDSMTSVVTFEPIPVPLEGPAGGVGLTSVDGHPFVVAADGTSVLLGEPDTGSWVDRIELPGAADGRGDARILCMGVGSAGDRPVAVTGASDGLVCLWDLRGRRLLGNPITEHEGEVRAVHLTEIDGRAIALTAGWDRRMRVWDLGRA